jgi:hypothetical protein
MSIEDTLQNRIVPELIEVQNELKAMRGAMAVKKAEAISKYWSLAGKKVRLKENGKEYYAKPLDMFTEGHISASIYYELHKTPEMKKMQLKVHESAIEEVV